MTMLLRNARLYRLPEGYELGETELDSKIAPQAFSPCGPGALETCGWITPYAADDGPLVASVMGAHLLRMRRQMRVLPAAAVNEVLAERRAEFEARMERPARRAELRSLREEVYASLLPRALLRSQVSMCLIVPRSRWIAVGESSDVKAECMLDLLRRGLGTLPVAPLLFVDGVGGLLSRIVLGHAPGHFAPGEKCVLRDPAAGAAQVRYQHSDLGDPTVQRYVEGSMRVAALEVVWRGELSVVISEDGALTSIRDLETGRDVDNDDHDARIDADLAIAAGTLGRLIDDLAEQCGGFYD